MALAAPLDVGADDAAMFPPGYAPPRGEGGRPVPDDATPAPPPPPCDEGGSAPPGGGGQRPEPLLLRNVTFITLHNDTYN